MAKKKTDEKALNLDNILFHCRDILRAARNSGSFFEKRDMMFTLVFLRLIGEKYDDGIKELRQTLIEQGLDYEKEMTRIQAEMKEVMKQEKESQQMLEEAFRGIGYGINEI